MFFVTVRLFVLNVAMLKHCVGNRTVWVFICNGSDNLMLFGKHITFLHFHIFSVLFYECAHLVLESFVLFCNEHDECQDMYFPSYQTEKVYVRVHLNYKFFYCLKQRTILETNLIISFCHVGRRRNLYHIFASYI